MGVYEAWDVEAVVANCQEEVENFAIDVDLVSPASMAKFSN